jgi:hypothetical protein
MPVRVVPSGIRGFDCNFPLSTDQAKSAVRHGYRFVARYLPRIAAADHDLSLAESKRVLATGLAISPVQHVERENWDPILDKGKTYGMRAAQHALLCGAPEGTTIWLDLEGVRLRTAPETVIQYCNAWYDQVASYGYLPGIYVGWQAILTADQLYRRLKFERYWSAYNLDSDLFPAVVGVCMMQGVANARMDYPPGWSPKTHQIDTNIVLGDALERFPTVMAPDDWNVWR